VAVLAEGAELGKTYFSQNSIKPDYIASKPLSLIGVEATPSLLLVDNNGVVRSVWIGRLDDLREQEVFASLQKMLQS
jgi:hypothetical protein